MSVVQEFMKQVEADPLVRKRIELACEVGLDAGFREVRRMAAEAGLNLSDEEAHQVLDLL